MKRYTEPYHPPIETHLEEETLPHYSPGHYCPVELGDTYQERYQIKAKIGYGAYSTSWLCRDLRKTSYGILKVSTYLLNFPTATDRERNVYEPLSKVDSLHPGQSLIRELYGSFDIVGPVGRHSCLVFQPMHMTLLEMMRRNSKPFGLPLLKMTVKRLLLALDFLHSDAGVVHTDLKTDNLMLSLEDDNMLSAFAEAEAHDPSPRKIIDESRTIYKSRPFSRPPDDKGYGLPILCDFGEARIGKRHESGPFVQLHIYRAPERLALMVALIGPPPAEFGRRSETTGQCFDPSAGAWLAHADAVIPPVSLENLERRLSGQEKESFLDFLRSMLKWPPEERKTARQLLQDPWLLEPTDRLNMHLHISTIKS
ncbi:protein kinase [Aspergillus ellipticus CBS 707.79]|uniref:non-specific serine/threonine protein kinase n=1 Tax=Aspergillus ellipticus CBS 707.79 TaxID=1448320 RepID=A0A319DTN3_9EURO|nr:protein kinase [Aspergillus ellipticus CBS 707.79]